MLPSQKYSPSTGPRAATPSPPPRLKYFISRSNGKIVPLIPADELPYKVRLFEVPRVMRMEQTEGMTHVGMHPTTGQCFKLESDVLHSPADATILERRTMDAPKQLSIAPNARPSTPNRGTFLLDSSPPLQVRLHGAEAMIPLRPIHRSLSTTLSPRTLRPVSTLHKRPSRLTALPHPLRPAAHRSQETRFTVHTGFATASAITYSRAAATSTRCQTKRLLRASDSGQCLAGGRRRRLSSLVRVPYRPWVQ